MREKHQRDLELVKSETLRRKDGVEPSLPKAGSKIDVWFKLDECGVWWSGKKCLFRIPDKYPNQGGVPPIDERIEVEVAENLFMPGVVVGSSQFS